MDVESTRSVSVTEEWEYIRFRIGSTDFVVPISVTERGE